MEATCPPRLHEQLYSAAGYLGHTCAFVAFDSYSHHDARRIFRFASASTEEAGDWHLRAKMQRVRDTLIAVGTADDHFAHADPANDPSLDALLRRCPTHHGRFKILKLA